MKIGYPYTYIIFASFLLSVFVHQRAQAENDGMLDGANQNSNPERVIGEAGKFLAKTKVIPADRILVEKITLAKSSMKEISRTSKDEGAGPQTIENAAAILSRRINMACPPTRCFEYEGVFYFSGGTSALAINDFSSGLAIHKGETTIYQWMPTGSADTE